MPILQENNNHQEKQNNNQKDKEKPYCKLPSEEKILVIMYYIGKPIAKEKLKLTYSIIERIMCNTSEKQKTQNKQDNKKRRRKNHEQHTATTSI